MAKDKIVYKCTSCGAQTLQWLGQCPVCHEWNTLECVRKTAMGTVNKSEGIESAPLPLLNVTDFDCKPFSTGLADLDRVLGGGLSPGAAILAGGEPGIGKSTLFLQVCGYVAKQRMKTLYVSGEESLPQIKSRGTRLGILSQELMAMTASKIEDVITAINDLKPSLLVLDSVQTFVSEGTDGLAGNASQVRAVALMIIEVCKKLGCALIIIGHVTKDGTLAGPRILEHMVDTVVYLEGDRRQMFRLLRVFKNRFGSNEELLVFEMTGEGMKIIEDPSMFFLGDRDPTLSGTALAMAVEGGRPIVVEAQALVSRTFLNIPRRAALGFDINRLHLLLAVIEKRLKLNFGQVDIFAKVGGGIRVQEPGLDLALVAAILSSYYDFALPEKSLFWGEVDLNGQIRPAPAHKLRLGQATRLGFAPIIFSARGVHETTAVQDVATISDLQRVLFRKNR